MAKKVQYNILELYNRVYGPIGRTYNMPTTEASVNEKKANGTLSVVEFTSNRKSILGTPLFMPCKLGNYDLPNEPIIEIRGSKNIVKTQVDGQDGSFKELFSMNDYGIVIRGIIVQEDGTENYPEEIVRAVRDLCEQKTDIKISNDLTTMFGITNIVIESFEFPAIDGSPGVQPYLINALSDKEMDIELKR